MKNSFSLKVLSFCLCMFFPTFIYAQGILRGSVIDSVSGDALVGAHVFLVGTALGVASDLDGSYQISGIPVGEYSAKISYIGYRDRVYKIKISKESNRLDARLVPDVVQGEEVVITAQRRGQNAAINQQITSKSIVNVVSEEKIQELPDANAAEAIGRMPGVSLIRSGGEATGVILRGLSSKFTNITIDGVKVPATDPNSRDVDMSTISQGSLAGIEVYKTLTPDQDGDAIAGTINLVTKKAPSERSIRVDAKGDYNDLMQTLKNQFDVSAKYSERFFDDLIGLQIQGNTERKIRSVENDKIHYAWANNSALTGPLTFDGTHPNDYSIDYFDSKFTDELRTRNGGQAILDVNTPDSGSVKLSGAYSQTGRNIMTYFREYPAGAGGWQYHYEYKEQTNSTANISLQGENYLSGFTVDWNVAFAQSQISNPFDYVMLFDEQSGGSYNASKDHPEINILPFQNNNFNQARLDSSYYLKQDNYEKENTYQLNLTKKLMLWGTSNDLKFGAKYKDRSRWMDADGYRWNNSYLQPWASGVDFTGTQFAGLGNTIHPPVSAFFDANAMESRKIFGTYNLFPLVDVNALKQWYQLTKNGVVGSLNQGVDGLMALQTYNVQERVAAGYIMNTTTISDALVLIYGVRLEQENDTYTGKDLVSTDPSQSPSLGGTGDVITLTQGTFIGDSTITHIETNVLPSVQILMKPADYLNIRLAGYYGLARPDYNTRLPKASMSGASSGGNLYFGNPNIKDAQALNLETGVQVFNNVIGMFGVSAFYKRIDNMYHNLNNLAVTWSPNPVIAGGYSGLATAPAGSYVLDSTGFQRLPNTLASIGMGNWFSSPGFKAMATRYNVYNIFTAYNSKDPSYIWGFELEHQFNLGFVPVSWLQNVTLSYNFTICRSQTNILAQSAQVDSFYNVTVDSRTHVRTLTEKGQTVQTLQWVNANSEDQPEFYGNAAIGYDIGGFSARFSVFYQDKYVSSYGAGGIDSYVNEFIKCDLALKQRISNNVSLMMNVNNIFNRQDVTSNYNEFYPYGYILTTQQLYGASIDFGLRVTI